MTDTSKCGTCGIFRLTTIIAPNTRTCPECGLRRRPIDFEKAKKKEKTMADADYSGVVEKKEKDPELRKRLTEFTEFLTQPGAVEKRDVSWVANQLLAMMRETE
jgi:hypothetical protein